MTLMVILFVLLILFPKRRVLLILIQVVLLDVVKENKNVLKGIYGSTQHKGGILVWNGVIILF